MNNREKMEYHIAKAEEWQVKVKALEDEAERKAKVKVMSKEGLGHRPEYIAKTLLKDNFWYDRAIGNRDGHETQAQMYGIAAILDEISFRPPAVVYKVVDE